MKGFIMNGPTGQQFEEARGVEDFDLLAELARCHAISKVEKDTAIRFRYKGGGNVFRSRYERGMIILEVPHWAAGFVIGKSGRSVRILEELCGCPVEVRPFDDTPRLNALREDFEKREAARKASLRETRILFYRSMLHDEFGPEEAELTDGEVLELYKGR